MMSPRRHHGGIPDRSAMRDPSLQFIRVINKLARLAQSPTDYGTGEALYFSELQVIDALQNNPRVNVTALADLLGITTGTVSPIVNRLAKRGYIKRSKVSSDGRVVRLELAEKGMVAFKGLQRQAREYAVEYAKEISFGEWAIFNEILVKLEAFVDKKMRNGG
jgi:DNA-binding MarR family transcriptional regulator